MAWCHRCGIEMIPNTKDHSSPHTILQTETVTIHNFICGGRVNTCIYRLRWQWHCTFCCCCCCCYWALFKQSLITALYSFCSICLPVTLKSCVCVYFFLSHQTECANDVCIEMWRNKWLRITYNNAGIRSKKKNGNNPVVREKTINLNRNGCHLKGKVNRTRKWMTEWHTKTESK